MVYQHTKRYLERWRKICYVFGGRNVHESKWRNAEPWLYFWRHQPRQTFDIIFDTHCALEIVVFVMVLCRCFSVLVIRLYYVQLKGPFGPSLVFISATYTVASDVQTATDDQGLIAHRNHVIHTELLVRDAVDFDDREVLRHLEDPVL